MKAALRSSRTAILSSMLKKNLTVTEAAREADLHPVLLSKLLQADRPVAYSTAGKLMRAFGDDVVTVEPRRLKGGD